MHAVLAIAIKDIVLLFRDKGNAFFTFIFPILIALFFGAIFGGAYGGGGGSALDVALVVLDKGPAAAQFSDDFIKSDGLQVQTAATREDGETLVRLGKVVACVIVPEGFQEGADNMFAGQAMKLEAVVDPRHNAEAGLLTGKLNELAFRQMASSFTDTSRMTRLLANSRESIKNASGFDPERRRVFGEFFDSLDSLTKDNDARQKADAANGEKSFAFNPVQVSVTELASKREGPRSSFEVSFPQGIVWGLMGCVTAFGASLASERARGTLTRLAVAPITRPQILLGKALACFLSCLLIQVILLGLALVLGVRPSEWGMLGAVLVLNAFGFTGIMMLVAGFCRTEGQANGLGRALILILAMIGGGTVPLFILPKFVQLMSNASPFKWATIATEASLWRAFTWQQFAPIGAVLVGFGVVGYLIGSNAFRWSGDK